MEGLGSPIISGVGSGLAPSSSPASPTSMHKNHVIMICIPSTAMLAQAQSLSRAIFLLAACLRDVVRKMLGQAGLEDRRCILQDAQRVPSACSEQSRPRPCQLDADWGSISRGRHSAQRVRLTSWPCQLLKRLGSLGASLRPRSC